MMLLACGAGVLSVGLRDSANPMALLELSHVRKMCNVLRKDESTQRNRTAVEASEQRTSWGRRATGSKQKPREKW